MKKSSNIAIILLNMILVFGGCAFAQEEISGQPHSDSGEILPSSVVQTDMEDIPASSAVQTDTEDIPASSAVQTDTKDILPSSAVQTDTEDIPASSAAQTDTEDLLPSSAPQSDMEGILPSSAPISDPEAVSPSSATHLDLEVSLPSFTPTPEPTEEPVDTSFDFTVCFAGDINLDENWCTTQYMSAQENGIYDCISEELVDFMQDADIMCLNNEFTYSLGGSPLSGKAYTFRADPEWVEVLHQLGVDAVTLANNHVYDYGKEALLDTFTVLEEAEIPYFGAGRTLQDAMEPLYLEVDGKVVALVAASRAEKYKMTPQATETEPGILRCYDTELFQQVIREAKENADFCIAFVHWGTEYSYTLEQVQMDTGKEYLDAGADAVIGAHSHCLQGLEYYDGKPIVYSLGNYWFNEKTLDTMLVQLHFVGDETQTRLTVQVIPAVQAGYTTTYAGEAEEQRRIYDFLESISVNVEISDEGIVIPR